MITTLRTGRLPSTTYEGSCNNCNAVFRWDKSDMKVQEPDRPHESPSTYIDCQTQGCNTMVFGDLVD